MSITATDDPDGRLFDDIYAHLRGKDPTTVPWANASPHRLLTSWLDERSGRGIDWSGQRALVIGAGLGDDANALAELGFRVTAFDYSPHAIAWARERFPDVAVDWHVADLFALPDSWRNAFDLVVEVHTIQALPPTRRQETIRAITGTMATDGDLVVISWTHEAHRPRDGRPWPLTLAEIDSIERHGVVETGRLELAPSAPGKSGRIRVVYRRRT